MFAERSAPKTFSSGKEAKLLAIEPVGEYFCGASCDKVQFIIEKQIDQK